MGSKHHLLGKKKGTCRDDRPRLTRISTWKNRECNEVESEEAAGTDVNERMDTGVAREWQCWDWPSVTPRSQHVAKIRLDFLGYYKVFCGYCSQIPPSGGITNDGNPNATTAVV